MKARLALSLACTLACALQSTGCRQSPQPNAATKPQEEKPQVAAPAPSYATTPFDVTAQGLPPGYKGHDIEAVCDLAAYPVGKSIDGLYAFRPESRLDGKDNDMAIFKALNFTYAGYRVDKVSLRTSSIPVWGSTSKDPYTRLGSVRAVAIKSRSFSSEYIGQNAFSAKITVNKLQIEEFNIVVDRIPRPMTVNLEVNQARDVLFICKLRPPLFHDGYSKKEATFTDPWDVSTKHKVLYVDLKAIWFCDAASGEILRKCSLD